MKRFLRTTKQTFESIQDKSQYNNSLVLIEDQKCIWSNGVYYGLPSDVNWSDIKNHPIITNGNGLKYLSDDGTYKEINLEIPVVLPNPETLQIEVIDSNGNKNEYTYDGSTNLQVPIDLSNITNTIDVTFESDFAPNLYVVGEGNQFRLTGDGYIPTQDEFNTLSNTVNGKQDKISDLDTIRNNANLGASALQSVPSEYITETELNSKGYATQSNLNTLTDRVTTVENYTVPDARNNVLWIGTSIPAGDIQHGNNGTSQSITTNLGSNNYPKMVADALGFNLYNNSRGSSFVCFYPPNEDGTANWASASDWSEYSSEVWKGYSLSASFAQVDEKFGPNGLNCPQWLINNFKSYSYESLIIPYIDGTLASCDTVVIDHGYNDRAVILNEASWHPGDGETQFKVGSGRDWLLKLQDPFETTLEAETYFQGKWWNDESVSSKKHYMSAIIFLAKKIWAVNPKIKIIIGNYFASKSNTFGAEFGNDRLAEFVNLANSACASWLRVNCVDVWKHTGIYNRNLPAGNDFQLFCPDGVHPHSDSTGHSNKIIAGVYINSIQGTLYI